MRAVLFLFLFVLLSVDHVWGGELLLTTYYPPPNGQFRDLGVSGTITAGIVNVTGVLAGRTLTASGMAPRIEVSAGAPGWFSVDSFGNVVVRGNLDMTSGAISGVVNLATTPAGKIYSASTVAGDSANVVATKNYVDAKVASIAYGTCYLMNSGGGDVRCAANYVVAGREDTWFYDPVHGNTHMYRLVCCRLR